MDNQNTEIQFPRATEEQAAAAPSPQPRQVYASSSDELLVIPRVVFNYGVIALSFFVIGLIIGGVAISRLSQVSADELRQLIKDGIAQAVSETNAAAPAAQTGPDPNVRYNASADNDPFEGPADAPVTIIEFGDYRCGFCARFAHETVDPLMQDYNGQIRLVFRDYPILGQTSLDAAMAAECANSQGRYWPYHDLLYQNQDTLGRETFIALASELNLDVDTFTTCIDDQTFHDEVMADFADGQQLGVTGTPTFYINGRPVIGAQPYAVFASVIDEELAAVQNESLPSSS